MRIFSEFQKFGLAAFYDELAFSGSAVGCNSAPWKTRLTFSAARGIIFGNISLSGA